jgi:hypothetical protein
MTLLKCPPGTGVGRQDHCWEKPEMKNVFAFAVAMAVVLSAGVQAEAGLFGGCHKNRGCASACEPVCCEAAPVCCEAAPVCCEAAPVCCEEPAPCCEPAPVCEPAPCAPVCEEPAPCCEPAPVCCEEAAPCCHAKKRCGFFKRHRARSHGCGC